VKSVFHFKSNIGPLFENLNQIKYFSPFSKVATSKLLSSFKLCGTLFVVYFVVKLLYSFSTWWAIVAQYKEFKKSQELRPLLC